MIHQIIYPFLIINSEGSGQPATQYLCGFSGSDSTLVLLESEGYLLLDGRYWEQGEREIVQYSLTVIPDRQHTWDPGSLGLNIGSKHESDTDSRASDPGSTLTRVRDDKAKTIKIVKISKEYTQKQALEEIVRKYRIKEITVDSRITSLASVKRVEDMGVSVKGEEGITQRIREFKMIHEQLKIKKAQEIALGAFEKLRPEIVVGASERYLAARLEFLMKELGADRPAFDTIVASGPHSALPHATVTDRTITANDAIIVDFGARYAGYCSDFTRTILMSDAPQRLHEIYAIVERAQSTAIAAAVVGTPLKDIDHAARQVITDAGYGDYFVHATGHGVGMEVHELPHVSYRSEAILQSGHVITIEPGIYIPDLGGVRLEEMVLVTTK